MTQSAALSADMISSLKDLVGPKGVIEGPDRDPHLEEWRGRWQGETPLILAPRTTKDLTRIVGCCHEKGIPLVPQGGNTGVVGAQVPRGEVLVTLKRMTAIRDVSAQDFSLTAEAGVTLQAVQEAAAAENRLFPLSIGSEGTCQIGGVLSSNAGGVAVLRYGNARDLCLGIEAVLPDGRVWNGLNRLRKNNTGYDLKHLFIGGEGTLGFITAAVLRLFPRPAERVTAFLAVPSASEAVDLLGFAQERSGGSVTSFELMNAAMVEIVLDHFPDLPRPVEVRAPAFILMELSAGREGTLGPLAEDFLAEAFERGLVTDGTIAQSEAQSHELWTIRHNATEAMKLDPTYCVKCDVAVPIPAVPGFLAAADRAVAEMAPGARVIAFGHMGDGNIHYDILGPKGMDDAAWRALAAPLERRVHDVALDHDGTISAEHGIGVLKRDELAERKSAVEMDLMRAVKAAIDPKGLMNPGKLL